MKSKNKLCPPTIGGSSLLVTFAVLCLTTFTLLALSTAKADSRLSNTSIQAVINYYNADFQAETIFAQLRQEKLPEQVSVQGNLYTFTCSISDTQNLLVELRKEKESWSIVRWQAVSTTAQ